MRGTFKLVDITAGGRIGKLKINNKEIDTPVIFFQYPFRNYRFFWKDVSVNALLVNAYFLFRKKSLLNNVQKMGIKKFLNFDGILMMDSGGHQIQKYGYPIKLSQISYVYNVLQPDIGVVLDKPVHPGLPKSDIKRAVDYMIQNYYSMRTSTNIQLLPVIHGYSREVIERCVEGIESQLWGVGSLVPLILGKTSNVIGKKVTGIKNGRKILVDIICLIRKIIGENAFLHVFGIGSALTMHIMFYLGVDSVDSASYEWFARYGHIQLPGRGRINVSGRAQESYSKQRAINWELYNCDCPVCSSTQKSKISDLLKTNKDARVVHNLYVHNKEVAIAREKIEENNYEAFLEKRLKNTQFYRLFKYAQRVKNSLRI